MKRQREEQITKVVDVRKLALDMLKDVSNYNNITTLLELVNNDNPKVVHATISNLHYIFVRLAEKGLMDKTLEKEAAKHTVSNWLNENRKQFLLLMAKNLRHSDLRVQITCFEKSIDLLSVFNHRANEFQNEMYRICVYGILSMDSMTHSLRETIIRKLNQYDDLRYYFFKNTHHFMNQSSIGSVKVLLDILLELDPAKDSDIRTLNDLNYQGADASKKSTLMKPSVYKKAFSDCWISLLALPMDHHTYSAVLEILHSQVIPNLSDPTALMDFLVDAYNSGGMLSILALNGLFTLIIGHNLDYPLFYHKLYALIDQNILHVKYRSRFFRLVDTFLSSSMLPSKMIASFIKRICHLALWAPPSGVLITLPLVFNLLRKHPLCIQMIHNNSSEPKDTIFLVNELDPSHTNAIDSSLWELQMLKKHYCPQISKLASIFEESLARPSYDLEDFLDQTYKSLIDLDLENKKVKDVRVEVERAGSAYLKL